MNIAPSQEHFDQKLIDSFVHDNGNIEDGSPQALSRARLLHCLFTMPEHSVLTLVSYLRTDVWDDASEHYGGVVENYLANHELNTLIGD